MKKALIAMSGGVDSSVAAYLTQQAGYDCAGVTMLLYQGGGEQRGRTCCSQEDIEDAYRVALRLGMPFHVCNLTREFRELVMLPFAQSYLRGETPNPCIACNRHMKFDLLHEHAWNLGCEFVVTGHYARIAKEGGRWRLYKASVPEKDQSYVLYDLTQETLAHTLFPLGGMAKDETRALARQLELPVAAKRDSQDICFAPDGDYARVIGEQAETVCPPGEFVDRSGKVLGSHKGIIHYTVGQRRGLGISSEDRLYVLEIRPQDNTVVLGEEKELFSSILTAGDFNWIPGEPPRGELRCAAKIRYRQKEQPATVWAEEDGRVTVTFDQPQRAITRGQAVVLYDGDEVLGGGTIL